MKYIFIITLLFIFFSCKNNNAVDETNNLPIQLSDELHKASCVYLTSDEKNNPLVSWCETDTTTGKKFFFFSIFNDSSQSFSNAIPIPIKQSASLHEEGMPKIAVKGDGTIIAVYETSEPTKENEYSGFLYYIQSPNNGKSWTQPHYLDSDSSASTSHSFASLARLSDGEVAACWLGESLDHEKEGRPVMFSKTLGYEGFQNQLSITPSACECCRTAISSNLDGHVAIMFRNLLDSSVRDISVSVSNDAGKSFSKPTSFSNDGWMIYGCPHNGPSVVSGENNNYSTWYTGGRQPGIYYAKLDKNRQIIKKVHLSKKGRFAQICLSSTNHPIIVYNELFLKGDTLCSPIVVEKISGEKIFKKIITPQDAQASYPVLQPYKKNAIIVAWNENGKIYYHKINADDITDPSGLPAQKNNKLPGSFSLREMPLH